MFPSCPIFSDIFTLKAFIYRGFSSHVWHRVSPYPMSHEFASPPLPSQRSTLGTGNGYSWAYILHTYIHTHTHIHPCIYIYTIYRVYIIYTCTLQVQQNLCCFRNYCFSKFLPTFLVCERFLHFSTLGHFGWEIHLWSRCGSKDVPRMFKS